MNFSLKSNCRNWGDIDLMRPVCLLKAVDNGNEETANLIFDELSKLDQQFTSGKVIKQCMN